MCECMKSPLRQCHSDFFCIYYDNNMYYPELIIPKNQHKRYIYVYVYACVYINITSISSHQLSHITTTTTTTSSLHFSTFYFFFLFSSLSLLPLFHHYLSNPLLRPHPTSLSIHSSLSLIWQGSSAAQLSSPPRRRSITTTTTTTAAIALLSLPTYTLSCLPTSTKKKKKSRVTPSPQNESPSAEQS